MDEKEELAKEKEALSVTKKKIWSDRDNGASPSGINVWVYEMDKEFPSSYYKALTSAQAKL